jgi:hypothetical protein
MQAIFQPGEAIVPVSRWPGTHQLLPGGSSTLVMLAMTGQRYLS